MLQYSITVMQSEDVIATEVKHSGFIYFFELVSQMVKDKKIKT
jgi:hypothetical protein